MNLRPHHLMCIQNYTGKGYDDAFTTHMDEVVEMLKRDPDIRLTKGCDELCSACPHNMAGTCDSAEKVDRYDREVLTACSLTYGEIRSWMTLTGIVKKQIFSTEQFEKICSDCQWYGICSMSVSNNLLY